MPWFKHASNDYEVLLFSDRMYDGYGISNWDGGMWTLPDPVAPRDPNENTTLCNPNVMQVASRSLIHTNCGELDNNGDLIVTTIIDENGDEIDYPQTPYYSITWGPILEGHEDYDYNDPKNNYIPHDKDPNTYGRMHETHGYKLSFDNPPLFC